MANNIAVSVTADVADLQAKRAIASAELRALNKDLNDYAKTAASTGATDTLKTSMLASATAVAKKRNEVGLLDRQLKSLTGTTTAAAAAEGAEAAATEASTAAHVNNRAATEGLVLVHEALSGRYTRMTGSAMILTQAMAGQERVAAAVGAVFNPLVIVTGVLAAGMAYLAFQEWETQKATAATAEAFALTGHGMNESAIAVRAQIAALEELPHVSHEAAQKLIDFDAAHANVDARLAEAANQLIPLYVKAFGKEGPEAVNKLKEALSSLMGEPAEEAIRKFNELNRSQLNLTPTQVQIVEGFLRQRDAMGAVLTVLQDIAQRGGGHVDDLNSEIRKTEEEIAKEKHALQDLQETMRVAFDADAAVGLNIAIAESEKKVDALTVSLQRLKALAALPTGEDLTTATRNSHETLLSLRDSALKARDAVKQLHDEMDQRRRANPNDPEVIDYFAHQPRIDRDLQRKMDPTDFKKGPDIVSVWTEQLHAAEVKSGEFFRDQTEMELKFWQGKLALTTAGSKQYLQVQEHIYTAQRTLARQAYNDQLALLDEQLQADHENWAKEQADWNAKLAYLKSHFGAESSEYRNAYREFERAQQEHEQKMAQVRRQAAQEQLSELQEDLHAEQEMRSRALQAEEAAIKARAQESGNPLAGVSAEQKIARLQAEAIQRQIADLTREHLVRSEILDQEVSDAKNAYGAESEQYAKAVAEKAKLDHQYFNQRRLLVNQAANAEIQAQQRVRAAWHAAIDPLVQATGSNIVGLISKTETWQQALISVGEAGLNVVVGALERIAEQTIVNAIVSRAAQTTSAEAGIAASAAQAGAAGVASMAGAPFPIDLGAPEFGAAMAKAAMAFSFGGFAKGIDVVPNDMIALIHEGERVVPASDNRKLMAAADAASGRGAASSPGPTSNVHVSININAVDAQSVRRLFENNASALTATLKREMRNLRF